MIGGYRRRARRRGLIVGAAVGSAAARRHNNQQEPTMDQGSAGEDPMADLEKLAQLKDQGILTQEEFDAKKKQILGL